LLKQSNDWHNIPTLSAAIYYMRGAKQYKAEE